MFPYLVFGKTSDAMKSSLVIFFCLASLTASPLHAKLNVVTTLPDFAAIAREIGGDKIKVTSIARGTEDPHFVDARPSFIRLLNQADLLIEGGAELEIGWLPPLVNGARNSKILGDNPGHLLVSRGIRFLEVPSGNVDRSAGDIHPFGNPHFWLDPANGKIVATNIAERLAALDSVNASFYMGTLHDFTSRLDNKIQEWTKRMEPHRGIKIITYHKSFEYLAARFGFTITDQIEPKPGIEPSPAHINSLIPRAKQEEVKLVLIEPFRPRKTPQYLAKAAGASLVIVPTSVGGNDKAVDYISLFDYDLTQIEAALGSAKK